MGQKLKQIYQDLASGKLSRSEALEQIRQIKLTAESESQSGLLAGLAWEPAEDTAAQSLSYAQTHVLVIDQPEVVAEDLASQLGAEAKAIQSEPGSDVAASYSQIARQCFDYLKQILSNKPQGQVLVQIAASPGLYAGLSGLLKTAQLENPQLIGQLILSDNPEQLSEQLAYNQSRPSDSLIRYRNGQREVPQWEELNIDSGPVAFKDDGVYLITGGLGGLGRLFIDEIQRQTSQAQIIVTGRSTELAEDVEALGVIYRSLDVNDGSAVSSVLSELHAEYGGINGILHSAGMIQDNFILKKPAEEFAAVLEPKVMGTYHLDQASAEWDLDFMVLFSSLASASGNVGQSDYASGNGFMDCYAAYRNELVSSGERSGRTLSVNWPLWSAGGMQMDATGLEQLALATGMHPMSTETGMSALYASLASGYGQTLVMEGALGQLRETLSAKPTVVSEPVSTVSLDAGAVQEQAQDYIRQQLSSLLKMPSHKIDPQAPLENYGIDSILAMNLTNELEKTFGSLPKTLFFEYQTIAELTEYFVSSHGEQLSRLFAVPVAEQREPVKPVVVPKRVRRRRFRTAAAVKVQPSQEPIAIIGLSGRYPEAADLAVYWENLRTGKDCIVEVPESRWNWQEHYSEDRTQAGRHYSKWGGFIEGVDEFDPLFFNISPLEAESIDPQERLFLQHAWMAVEDAGYTRESLQLRSESGLSGQVGVYAGVMYGEYLVSGSLASIANRVSYVLNLHGPSMTLDTMCSSSLTAIHLACQDLRSGRTDLGLAGGVNVSVHPNKYLMLSEGQFISSDGHCQSFGEGGDGYIPGEGVGVVLLKRLSEAERDADHIYGLVKGSALNHGGKTNGYTVPNLKAQAGVIGQALREFATDPRHVSYVEAHGTGTKLGDPIEIAALSQVFGRETEAKGYCLIGSAKSNVGHCESAAGIAGLTKVLLQMKHGEIVPSLHSSTLNPNIDFERTPFVVNQELRSWERPVVDGVPQRRIAGISSFGAGGSNAHMVIEEYVGESAELVVRNELPDAVVVPLSARTEAQLRQKAEDLLEFIRTEDESLDLLSLAYTLQVGREAMGERLGVLVSSLDELSEKLQAYVDNQLPVEGFYQGQVKRNKDTLALFTADADLQDTLQKWINKRHLNKLLDLWVKGLELDWGRLYGEARPRRISLPTYPFAKERYWIDTVASHAASSQSQTAVLHPLLHSNTSSLKQQSYRSVFNGNEPFITDQGLLSSGAYLEMIRAAVEDASEPQETGILELHETVWGALLSVGEERPVNLALLPRGHEVAYEIYSGEDEVVHCQGYAVVSDQPGPGRLALDNVKAGLKQVTPVHPVIHAQHESEHGILAEIRLTDDLTESEYGLHPTVLNAVLTTGASLLGGNTNSGLLASVDKVRLVFGSQSPLLAWIRHAGEGLAIDLCTAEGAICMQLQGVRYAALQQAVEPVSKPVAEAVRPVELSVPASSGLSLSEPSELSVGTEVKSKPQGISLATPAELVLTDGQDADTRAIRLSDVNAPVSLAAEGSAALSVLSYGEGLYEITLPGGELSEGLVAELLEALSVVGSATDTKVLVLKSASRLYGERSSYNHALPLYEALAGFAYPVIAALEWGAVGSGFLLASLCDFMVCSESGDYGYRVGDIFPSAAEEQLFKQRFGTVLSDDLLYQSGELSGSELRSRGWMCRIEAASLVESVAQELARELTGKPQKALRLLKGHLGRELLAGVELLHPVEGLLQEGVADFPTEPELVHAAIKLSLSHPAPGVLQIRLCRFKADYALASLVSDLGEVLEQAVSSGIYRAVLLSSDYEDFLPVLSGESSTVLDLLGLIRGTGLPVIALLEGNARGIGWLLAQGCDGCVYHRDGVYGLGDSLGEGELLGVGDELFGRRMGSALGQEVLLTGAEYRGEELGGRCGVLRVSEDVLLGSLDLARVWDSVPLSQLAEWKLRQPELLSGWELVESGPERMWSEDIEEVELATEVMKAEVHPEGILVVRMEDREAKNMFSEAFIEGIGEVFAHIARVGGYKVVILTGYENYFASGGTKSDLLEIQEGKAKFTDTKIYQLAMDCDVPVIAAMQGHGIGAGWALGMFADFVLLSEGSRYVSPYMNYGFTPGAGSTLVFPRKIGYDLSRETLLTGLEYAGDVLRGRGLALPVLAKAKVYPAALWLGQKVARHSLRLLKTIKQRWVSAWYPALEPTYAAELAMHDETFVGETETLASIETKFARHHQVVATKSVIDVTPESLPDNESTVDVTETLKQLLAQELRVAEEEIEEDTQFIDLGLDSITGVTWMRKINEKYQTAIEATKVYSYPTLRELSEHVKEAAKEQGTLSVTPALSTAPVVTALTQSASPSIASDEDALPGVIATLKQLLAQELRVDEDEIEEDTQFIDLGLDSITGVTWMRRINEKYQTEIEATKVYSYPTLEELSAHVKEQAEKLGTLSAAAPTPKPVDVPFAVSPVNLSKVKEILQSQAGGGLSAVAELSSWRNQAALARKTPVNARGTGDSIAVIGMAGQFPMANNLDEFWGNICAGKNCISEIPPQRWDIDTHYEQGDPLPGKTNSKWMGALEDYDRFDPMFFSISPMEAKSMDPQQRLFLQACWHSIEDAGYSAASLSGSKCGVFVGCAAGDYNHINHEQQLTAQGFTGSATSILAARISYFLNLQGPCLSIDTACSSSLVAIADACDSLISGDSDLALAGGVYVMATPEMHIQTSQSGMLSVDGRCYTFDQRANGFVPGEGVGVVLLKRLSEAEKDGDRVYALVRGWGVNQDGKTNGITAPNAQSQARLEQDVYARYQINPADIQLIEAHGTGTKLGDPIEIEGLKQSFKNHTEEQAYCAIGSVKSNIGHCITAAGVAGFIKAALALRHRQLPPTINYEQPNEHLGLAGSPFYINTDLQDWPGKDSVRRHAAVSSFGFSGTNAHLVVAEYAPPANLAPAVNPITQNGQLVFPLSAKTATQLQQKARDLLRFIQQQGNQVDLLEVAYTLQVGRDAMEERLGILAESLSQLADKLQAYLSEDAGLGGIYQGQVKRHQEGMRLISKDAEMKETIVAKWLNEQKLGKLLDLWVKGLELDWGRLYGEVRPRRISLPTYPFAKERYWIDTVASHAASSQSQTAVLHPLLHSNTSSLKQQSYRSVFNGNEPFITDQGLLSSGAYLEMIRAAVEDASEPQETGILELHETVWGALLSVGEERPVNLALLPRGHEVAYEIYSGEDEVVHCQGYAVVSDQPGPGRLALDELKNQLQRDHVMPNAWGISEVYRSKDQLLVELNLPEAQEDDAYGIHPSLLGGALQAATTLLGGNTNSGLLASVDKVRLVFGSQSPLLAWIRHVGEGLAIDLCTAEGAICMQLQGVRYAALQQAVEPVSKPVAEAVRPVELSVPASSGLSLSEPSELSVGTEVKSKPQGISLATPAELVLTDGQDADTRAIRLSDVNAPVSLAAEGSAALSVLSYGEGLYEITLPGGELSEGLVAELLEALSVVGSATDTKVLVLKSASRLYGERSSYNHALPLYEALAGFAYPVIAALEWGAVGSGFLLASLCDFMVCSESGDYGYRVGDIFPSAAEEQLFKQRFGTVLSDDLLYQSGELSGSELRSRGWMCRIEAASLVESVAQELARELTGKPQKALRLLKGHLGRELLAGVELLHPVEGLLQEGVADFPTEPELVHAAIKLSLSHPAPGVLQIRLCRFKADYALASLVSDLGEVLEQAVSSGIYRAVLLSSDYEDFLPVLSGESSTVLDLLGLIRGTGLPVIALLEGNARGIGWLLAQGCDGCVYHRDGVYGLGDSLGEGELLGVGDELFGRRMGSALGQEVLLTGAEYRGEELGGRCGVLRVSEDVLLGGLDLARVWESVPLSQLGEWKLRQPELLSGWELVESGPERMWSEDIEEVELATEVMKAEVHPEGILVVRMEDREAKNMFSEAFIEGIDEVFAHIARVGGYKVVILTGYENYFASGGTREGLLAIQQGKAKFTDQKIFQLALDCDVPVIAAMQGHGIGAGWVLGMFADFVLLSEGSRYVSPYMNYGFTPGAGSTLVFPRKIGYDLSRETLLTGLEYAGGVLRERGLPWPVLNRSAVVSSAFTLARSLALHQRSSLMALKQRWKQPLTKVLEAVYARELAMHEATFVGQDETLHHIHDQFSGSGESNSSAQLVSIESEVAVPQVTMENLPVGTTLAAVIVELKTLLAQELEMQAELIEHDAQFVDLGVDSIIGVSWVRKINETFGISLEATKIYSYPTLNELGQWIKEQLPQSSEPESVQMNSTVGVKARLKELLATELEMPEEQIDDDAQFVDLGVDSIIGVSWVRKINDFYATAIEATKVYTHPTLEELSVYVTEQATHQGNISATESSTPVAISQKPLGMAFEASVVNGVSEGLSSWRNGAGKVHPSSQSVENRIEPIAAIGMAGQFPMADNLDQYWENLASGKDCIEEIPKRRWNIDGLYRKGEPTPGKTNSKWMGALAEYDLFDPLFFSISPLEAEQMDPQQRLFLQACWHSIEDAGYSAASLSGSKCGVFVGCGTGDYHRFSQEMGGSVSILAARISYFLNLQGPCLSIDTACSSSLVALANACDSLISRASDLALAGGVCVLTGPDMHLTTSQAGMLSPTGRCYSFDHRADGIALGEGVGVVMLKRLSDAQRDHDRVYGLIRGWGVNQDGKTNGITAPNPISQTRLQKDVYDKFKVDPGNIQLVEAHGTGTILGDPIEVEGLKESFKDYTQETGYCALGSVKSNIGHCMFAAGVSGFIKVLLALQHKQLPPTINYQQPNEHLGLAGSPFYVNEHLREWKCDESKERQAAISSFGFSGTNAHLVIAEHKDDQHANTQVKAVTQNGKMIIPLSAKTPEQLMQKARDLVVYLTTKGGNVEWLDLAYTLQVGRDAMDQRLGVVAGGVADLLDKLKAYLDGQDHIDGLYQGHGSGYQESLDLISQDSNMHRVVEHWISQRKFNKLLELWVRGFELDWSGLYGRDKPQRVSLPVYPFAKERYWKDDTAVEQSAPPDLGVVKDFRTIEDVIDQVDSDLIEAGQAVKLLKRLA